MNMRSLNKLATALTVVFAVTLVAIFLQILYVLWRRRLLHRTSIDSNNIEFEKMSSQNQLILYFSCWKRQSNIRRVQPNAPITEDVRSLPESDTTSDSEEDGEVKWHDDVYGMSRVLFTIKEEEREELESELDCTSFRKDQQVVIDINIGKVGAIDEVTTPFWTPCASPPYYTPSPSPPREGSFTSL